MLKPFLIQTLYPSKKKIIKTCFFLLPSSLYYSYQPLTTPKIENSIILTPPLLATSETMAGRGCVHGPFTWKYGAEESGDPRVAISHFSPGTKER